MRPTPPKHIVSYCVVVDHFSEQVLLVGGGRWWAANDISPVGDVRVDPHLPRFVDKLHRHVNGR